MTKIVTKTYGKFSFLERLLTQALMLFYSTPVIAFLTMTYGDFVGNDYMMNCAFFYILIFVLLRILYEMATENVNYIILDCPAFLKNNGKPNRFKN